jgi:hypothetical protein
VNAVASDLEKRISLVEDREAIRDLKHSYCYLTDAGISGDEASLDELIGKFTDDAWLDFGAFGVYKGKEALTTFFKQVVAGSFSFGAHMVGNSVIQVDGNSARGKWLVLAPGVAKSKEGDRATWTQAMYDEEYVKVDGQWKWKSMKVTWGFFAAHDEGWAKTRMLSLE